MDTTTDQPVPAAPRPGAQHREVVRDAGFSRISLLSILAGTLAAFGAFALLAAIVGSVLTSTAVKPDFASHKWTNDTVLSIVCTAGALFLAFLFGGYVAGRMARRSGFIHGLATFLLGLLALAATGAIVRFVADRTDVNRNLRKIGIPTNIHRWATSGLVLLIAAVAAMAVGALLGGLLGERWHTKLARRALDPDYGPEADARRQAASEASEREQAERDRIARETAERERVERERADMDETRSQAIVADDERAGEREAVVVDDRSAEPAPVVDAGASALPDPPRQGRSVEAEPPPTASTFDANKGDDERLSASEWAQTTNREDEPRLSAAEWAEIERLQAARRNRT